MSTPIHDRRALGAIVRRRRQELGLTQADAASCCGVGRRLFYELENGDRDVAFPTVVRILDQLGATLHVDVPRQNAPRLPAPTLTDEPEPEWADWYRLTPQERWRESSRLWGTYLLLGGSLDPEPDTQSPFFDARAPRPEPAHGRPGVHLVRRSGV